jgi:hypothetical protein
MPSAVLFQDLKEQLGAGNHDFGSDTLKVALTNSVPSVVDTAFTDLTEITTGNGYTGGGTTVSGVAWNESGGTGTLTANQTVFTAAGGAIASFQYYVLYNDTTTSPADALIAYWDHGSAVSLASGETFTIKWNGATNGSILTIS